VLVQVSSLWSVGVAEAGARLSTSASAKVEKVRMGMGLVRYMRVWLFVIGIVMGLGLEVLRRKRGVTIAAFKVECELCLPKKRSLLFFMYPNSRFRPMIIITDSRIHCRRQKTDGQVQLGTSSASDEFTISSESRKIRHLQPYHRLHMYVSNALDIFIHTKCLLPEERTESLRF
jgi:hypothetical protein